MGMISEGVQPSYRIIRCLELGKKPQTLIMFRYIIGAEPEIFIGQYGIQPEKKPPEKDETYNCYVGVPIIILNCSDEKISKS